MHLAWPSLCVHTFYIFTLPPPNKFLFRFRFLSLTISRLFSFLLVSEVKFYWTNIKKISMVSIYSLRLVYTCLYTITNDNVITSFAQKNKSFEILQSKKIFFVCTYRTLKPPLYPCTQSYAFGLTPPSPVCAYVLCGWLPREMSDS